jgi:uncharacterized membrane protein YhaH (DUF805 family)
MDLKTLLFSFKGRIGRQQHILGILGVTFSVLVPLLLVGCAIVAHSHAVLLVAALVALAWSFATIWASFALQVKRIQDRDHDWYFLLIQLIPVVGPIWFFVEAVCLRGTVGENRFGKDPVA